MPSSHTALPATLWPPPRTRDAKVVLAREVDRVDDVGGADALGDDRRALVGRAVPDDAGVVIAVVGGGQAGAAVAGDEGLKRLGVDGDGAVAVAGRCGKSGHGSFLASRGASFVA